MIIVILLVNLCIGLLNNTIAMINKKKEKVWKYARTKVWLRFINDRHLPPPLNLLSMLSSIFKSLLRSGLKVEEKSGVLHFIFFYSIRLIRCQKVQKETMEMRNLGSEDQETEALEVE